jgi:ParB family chromosome partitioning protein
MTVLNEEEIVDLPLDRVQTDPTQPRRTFDQTKLEELAQSIKTNGQIQPIVVFRVSGESFLFQIEEGERRYRACTMLGLPTIKAIVRPQQRDKRVVQNRRLAENIDREALSDSELALEFKSRIESGQSVQQIASDIHRSRSYVSQRLLILENPEVFEAMQKGELSFVQARDKTFGKPEVKEQAPPTNLSKFLSTLEVPKLYFEMTKKNTVTDLDALYNSYVRDLAKFRKVM